LIRNLAAIISARDPAERGAFLQELATTRRILGRELTFRHRAGRPVHTLVNAVGSFDEHGQLAKITFTIRPKIRFNLPGENDARLRRSPEKGLTGPSSLPRGRMLCRVETTE